MTKLTKSVVKTFEQDQQAFGTVVALYNLLALHAMNQLKALGVTKIKIS